MMAVVAAGKGWHFLGERRGPWGGGRRFRFLFGIKGMKEAVG